MDPQATLGAFLGFTLLISGALKLLPPYVPRGALLLGLGIPATQTAVLVWTVTGIELLLGAGILTQALQPWTAIAVAITTSAFLIVTIIAYVRHVGSSCECFGPLSRHAVSVIDIIRNATLSAAAIENAITAQASPAHSAVASLTGGAVLALTLLVGTMLLREAIAVLQGFGKEYTR